MSIEMIQKILKNDSLFLGDYYIEINLFIFYPEPRMFKGKIKLPQVLDAEKLGISFGEVEIVSYEKLLHLIFPECLIEDTQGIKEGHPDFIVSKGDFKLYLEIKYGNGGLRLSQMEWFFKSKDKDSAVLFMGDLGIEGKEKKSCVDLSRTLPLNCKIMDFWGQ